MKVVTSHISVTNNVTAETVTTYTFEVLSHKITKNIAISLFIILYYLYI
ncbi:hypothetical protein UFOVP129_55 [uncultured Caudovirales phage]|uniref:Uncharacterized protein n=1 Tax=uncultured Caudovirales phage TaxID=2100421 RepID=A0A6J5L9H0_9CAUD|nr:hypothetical protein UFOVP129_55 [uncultured Caudovirales phage]